ncbi:hypothetical protein SAMN05444004_11414 [Jannaschia faecimaris]|uniref:Uncharacterized protein n=1 Tax=Jannaschia faecimaris TaxID=1244108 RepID=A0A1H3SWC0_9RHOB|nr:hypothetical protein [Jannaschia faecimaris]SDZ42272.1 hypothetical protein SAMN05444004_11414 [Jannaschia faecimaris]
MIRAFLLTLAATQAGAVDLPDIGPALSPCLEKHVTGAPYVAALRAQGWTPVAESEKPAAQRNLSHALLAALHAEHGEGGSWADRWSHREETLAWVQDSSTNRPLYARGDAILLLMGEQITDETVGRIHRTTCLIGGPELDLVSRLLAEEAILPEGGLRSLSFLPEDEGSLPYSSVAIMRHLPDPGPVMPTHLDAVVTTQMFPVASVEDAE